MVYGYRFLIVLALFGAPNAALGDELEEIRREVRSRIVFEKMGWAGDKYAPAGVLTNGNCLTHARTHKVEAAKIGISGTIRHCVLWDDGEHAYFKTNDGRVLDNRFIGVVSEEDIGCVKWRKDIE